METATTSNITTSSNGSITIKKQQRMNRIENPFTLKVGQVFTGFGIGCGLGIGVGRPLNLGITLLSLEIIPHDELWRLL